MKIRVNESMIYSITNSYLKVTGRGVPGGAGVERILERHGRTLGFLDGENDQVSLLEEIYNDHDHD